MLRTVPVAALLLLLAAPAAAGPLDGARWQEFEGQRHALYAVPGQLSVTWAPGMLDSWPEDAPPIGPDVIEVAGLTLRRTHVIGAPRTSTEAYVADVALDSEATRALARELLLWPDVQTASPLWSLSPTDVSAPWAITDRVLVQTTGPAAEPALRALASRLGAVGVRERGLAPNQWVMQMGVGAPTDPIEASMRLAEQPWARWAEVDWLIPMEPRYLPDDDRFDDQWHLHNVGQVGGIAGNDMNVAEAWDITLGDAATIVADQDSGVDLDHPDLVADLLPGYDFTNGDDTPNPSGSHGTSVAGCMAAPHNGLGVVGVCPNCKILPVRVLGASSSGQADAHDFSVTNGAAVINNSWGPSDSEDPNTPQPIPNVVATAVQSAATSGRDGKGVAIFWAAGNGNNNGQTCSQDGYVSHPATIGVGASTNVGTRASYSERCPELELSAPSAGGTAGIVTTRVDTYTSTFGGTSAASPNAAGAAALILSALPELTLNELRELLRSSAQKLDPGDAAYDANGHSISYGYGRVDALAALSGQVATLSIPTGTQRCDAVLDVSVSIPTAPGLGTVQVTASSGREPIGEIVTLEETNPGQYEGTVSLADSAAVPSDGVLSVDDGDSVVISSVEADTARQVSVDCEGPLLSGFEVRDITPTSAVLFWRTNEPADGLATWTGGSADDPVVDLDHLAVALDLDSCTTFVATLSSTDAAGYTSTVPSALSWRTPGDPAVLPDDALDDADPCDESTWYEPETPAPGDDDDSTTSLVRGPGGFEGDGCTCVSSVAAVDGAHWSWLGLLALGALRRRR